MTFKNEVDKKEYQRKYYREWYLKNKKTKIKTDKERIKRNLIWFKEFTKEQKCNRCGYSDYRALEYHHIIPLNDNNSKMRMNHLVRQGWSIKRLEEYIKEELEILCANCHKIHHYGDVA